jgi:hypothetical protein
MTSCYSVPSLMLEGLDQQGQRCATHSPSRARREAASRVGAAFRLGSLLPFIPLSVPSDVLTVGERCQNSLFGKHKSPIS